MVDVSWALAKVEEARRPENVTSQDTIVSLFDALLAVRGASQRMIFGLAPGALDFGDAGRDTLERALRAALRESRDAFEQQGDAAALLELDKLAKTADLPELASRTRFPLRCDPLGDATSLDPRWRTRIALLAQARQEPGTLRWSRLADSFDDDEPAQAELQAPDLDALYRFALRYEQDTMRTFSRELAAVWAVADGIIVDDWFYVTPVKDWEWNDDGLEIGRGHYLQGSLTILATPDTENLADAPIVDRDDDGLESYRYANLAELLDRLLPDAPASSPAAKTSWWKRLLSR